MYGIWCICCSCSGLSLLFGFLLSRVLLYRFGGPILELKRRIENVVRGCPEEYRGSGLL